MRKAVIIVLSVCLIFGVFISSFYFAGNSIPASEPEAAEPEDTGTAPAKIVVWNKERDRKLFETEDQAVISAVSSLIGEADWVAADEPLSGDAVLSVYNENGQATEYTLQHTDAGITLIKQKPDVRGGHWKADFPTQSGALGSYIGIG